MTDGAAIFLKLCGGALLAAVCTLVLSELSKTAKVTVGVGGTVVLYGGILLLAVPVLSRLTAFSEGYAVAPYVTLLLKCLGIALTSQIVSDLCRELQAGTAAVLVETAGKCVILLLALPSVEKLLRVAERMLS